MLITENCIIIYNANIYTFNHETPTANGLVISNNKIIALLNEGEQNRYNGTKIDAKGQTILPGFIDAHCHLNAMIADAFAFSCPAHIQTFEEFIQHFQNQLHSIPAGNWVRINHFNPNHFLEKRLITKKELDQISTKHPIRVRHVSRHATILNTCAFNSAKIDAHFEAPSHMKINFENGILYGADAWLTKQVLPPYTKEQRMQQVLPLQKQLLGYGITTVHDATPTTTTEDLTFWQEAMANGWLIHTDFMTSIDYYQQNPQKQRVHPNTLKVVIEFLPELQPSPEDLKNIMHFGVTNNLSIAIHTVTPEMIWAVLDGIDKLKTKATRQVRLEHASLCPEAFIPIIAQEKIQIVTNPAFIYEHGERYLQDVQKDEQNWLYLIRSFVEAGIVVAAGSDAPVATANPFVAIYAACTRKTNLGNPVNAGEKIDRYNAFKLFTTNAAIVTNLSDTKGQLAAQYDADFFIIDLDPFTCSDELLPHILATSTWIQGKCVYQKSL